MPNSSPNASKNGTSCVTPSGPLTMSSSPSSCAAAISSAHSRSKSSLVDALVAAGTVDAIDDAAVDAGATVLGAATSVDVAARCVVVAESGSSLPQLAAPSARTNPTAATIVPL